MAAPGKDEGFRIDSAQKTRPSLGFFWIKILKMRIIMKVFCRAEVVPNCDFSLCNFLRRCFPVLERICMRIPSWAGELLLN